MDRRNHRAERRGRGPGDPSAVRFAQLMRDRHGAEVYLFASRARGTNRRDSDYDIAAVAPAFAGLCDLDRALDRFDLWDENSLSAIARMGRGDCATTGWRGVASTPASGRIRTPPMLLIRSFQSSLVSTSSPTTGTVAPGRT